MALSTCSELKASVASWLARTADTQITSNVADFITLAEAHINRNLRVRQQESTSTFTTTSGSTNLPDDYLAWRRLTWLGDTYVSLSYMSPDALNLWYPGVEDGIPARFTIEGGNIVTRPTNDSTSFSFLYYAKLTPLEDDTDTNWLLTANPDLYLSATLAEANAFLINPDHAALWAQKRDMIIAEMHSLSDATKGPAQMYPLGVVV